MARPRRDGIRHRVRKEIVNIPRPSSRTGPTRGGHAEPREQSLRIPPRALDLLLLRRLGLSVGQPQETGPDVGRYGAEVLCSGGAEAVVGRGDEVFDMGLVAGEVWVDVGLVDEAGALGLGEDEVEEEGEAEVGVEGDPSRRLG